MPVIWHEPKKRLGNAWKTDRSRIPPKPVWPGLDHNGRPIEETTNNGDGIDVASSGAVAQGAVGVATATAATATALPARGELAAKAGGEMPPKAPYNNDDVGDNSNGNSNSFPPPPFRSRKRKKPVPTVLKEITEDGHSSYYKERLALDLQDEAQKRLKRDDAPVETKDPKPQPPPKIEALSSWTIVVAVKEMLADLPAMARGITQIQSMLGNLASSRTTNDANTDTNSNASAMKCKCHTMDGILSRIESFATQQEAGHLKLLEKKEERINKLEAHLEALESSFKDKTVQALAQKEQESLQMRNRMEAQAKLLKDEYTKRIRELETEAGQRDDVITELQRAQEQERKESQNRVTEALHKIEQLQDQNDQLIRRNVTLNAFKDKYDMHRATLRASKSTGSDSQPPHLFLGRKNRNNTTEKPMCERDVRTSTTNKRSNSLDKVQNCITRPQGSIRSKTAPRSPPTINHGSDYNVNSHGTPNRRYSNSGHQSDDSPFSSGSISSTIAVARSKPTSIVPGGTIAHGRSKREAHAVASKVDSRSKMKATSIRDLIPNYALDSLARGRSQSSPM